MRFKYLLIIEYFFSNVSIFAWGKSREISQGPILEFKGEDL